MKFMKNKTGVEMGINFIIIATLGVLILVVAIFLIKRTTTVVHDEIPKIIEFVDAMWKPTSDNPVMLYPNNIEMKQGKSKITTLQVFNYAHEDVMCNLDFIPAANTSTDMIKFTYATTNRNIPVSMVGEWKIHIDSLKTATPNIYMYILTIDCGEFSNHNDIFISIK